MGLIDIHIHGQGGCDVMSPDPEQLLRLSMRLQSQGISGYLATFVSSSREDTLRALERLKRIQGTEKGARLLGVHLEGPFIHPDRKGAHNPRHLRPPSRAEAREWIAAGEGIVKLVTLAPELEGAPEVIRLLDRKGVRISMGHTTATFEQSRAAKKTGVRSVTHLFNAMNPLHHRAPGLAGFALGDDDLYTELIADGVHVSDEVVKLVLRCRDRRRIILISDGFFLTGHRASKIVKLGGLKVRTFPDGSLRLLDGTLAGSNATLREIVDRVIRMNVVPASEVTAMASSNPLELLGLPPPRKSS